MISNFSASRCTEPATRPLVPTAHRFPTVTWRESLHAVIRELETFPPVTEERFVHLGGRLVEITLQINEVAEATAAAAQLLSGEEMLGIVAGVGQMLDRMDGYLRRADERTERAVKGLEEIEENLGRVRRLMLNFKEQVSSLRMLKMLTSIQSACLGRGAAGFAHVAADIDALSRKVQMKSKEMIEKAKTLEDDLREALATAVTLAARQRHLAGVVIRDMRQGFASLAEMRNECARAALTVSGRSGEMSLEISDVVVSMQFHDITRQQMDHSREALVGLLEDVKSCGWQDGRERASHEDGLTGPAAVAAKVCDLQAAQLTHSSDELADAVQRITDNLRRVAAEAANNAARAHDMAGYADAGSRSSVTEIEHGLASVEAAFAENVSADHSLARLMLSVAAAMDDISRFLDEIEGIGAEIELIALNAIIKAAQAGRAGAPLSVIAEAVKKQSKDIRHQAGEITGAIVAIVSSVERLREDMDGRVATGAAGEEERMRLELVEILNSLKGTTSTIAALLFRADSKASSLSSAIEGALAGMEPRGMVAAIRGGIIPQLRALSCSARTVEPPRGVLAGEEILVTLEQHYTMRSERRIHTAFTTAGMMGRELGNLAAVVATGGNDRCIEGDFGDNVELF